MKKSIFVFSFIFSACLIFGAKKKMPEWITLPASVYPSETYMNGTGSGENRESAELEAVKNLSSIFGQTVDYVLKIADKMIEEGYLKCFVDGNIKYIRSLNKTEQKKMKLFA